MKEDKIRYIIAYGSDEVVFKREMPEDSPGSTKSREEVIEMMRCMGAREEDIQRAFEIIDNSEGHCVYWDCEWSL